MNNRIANDMISSGMIPSGEKKKEDLSRIQYGSAPSPSKLMDAYKSMYDKKEEVINEMSEKGMGAAPAARPGGITPYKDPKKAGGITPYKDPKKAGGITPYKKPETTAADRPKPETKSMVDTVKDRRKEVVSDRRERVQKIMNKYGESVDLLAAYRAVYEHHKKDADGNTIPHEDEEVNEGKIPAGLQAYLDKKKGKKEDKKEMKEGLGAAVKMGLKAVTKIAKSKAGKDFVKDMARGAATQFGANMVSGGSGGQQKQNTAGKASAGSYQAASADLFDIVKGQLLDEGLSEEEIKDIMLTLTPDEIMEELSDTVKRNDALNRERAMKAAQERKVPENVRAAQKRQYTAGGPKDKGENKYTTQDKKTIIDYHKNKESM